MPVTTVTQEEMLREMQEGKSAQSSGVTESSIAEMRSIMGGDFPIEVEESLFTGANVGEFAGGAGGAVVGGAAGMALGGPPGAVIGGVIGSGVGGAGGRAAGAQFIDERSPGTRELVEAGLTGMAFEPLGNAFGSLVGKGAGRVAGQRIPVIRSHIDNISEVQKTMREAGSFLTPAQLSETRVFDVIENVVEGSLLGGGGIRKLKRAQQKGLVEGVANKIVDEFGKRMEPEDLAAIFQKALEGEREIVAEAGGVLYRKVDELMGVGTRQVPLTPQARRNTLPGSIQEVIDSPTPGTVPSDPIIHRGTIPGGQRVSAPSTTEQLPSRRADVPGVSFTQRVRPTPQTPTPENESVGFTQRFRRGGITAPEPPGPPSSSVGFTQRFSSVPTSASAVNILSMKQVARKIIDENANIKGSFKSKQMVKMAKDLLDMPDQLSWGEAHAFRSSLLATNRDLGKSKKQGAQRAFGLSKRLSGMIDQSMTKSAENLSGEALTAWRKANSFWKENADRLHNELITSLERVIAKTPEEFGRWISRGKGISRAKAVERVVGRTGPIYRRYQAGYLEGFIQNVTDNVTGEISARNLANALAPDNAKQIASLVGPNVVRRLQKLKRAIIATQRPSAPGTPGEMVTQLVQGGAIIAAVSLRLTMEAAALLMSPLMVGKALTSPKVSELLIEGINVPRASARGAKLTARLMTVLGREGFLQDARTKQVRRKPQKLPSPIF